MSLGRSYRTGLVGALVIALAACDLVMPVTPVPVPPSRPSGLSAAPAPKAVPQSQTSRDLQTYYARLQNDLQTQGLMRTDGGGVDTPFRAFDLTRNFEQIVFYDEYGPGPGLSASTGRPGQLRRWESPVRIATSFGPSVLSEARKTYSDEVGSFAKRLARVSRHPISITGGAPNFHVIFASYDDRNATEQIIRNLRPDISQATLNLFLDPPRSTHCLVVAYSDGTSTNTYAQAIALIRSEHPDLLRQSCIHEELAQGLGLANDSPSARPSIFNDDDEFALLTTHDEMLIKMLYDDRVSAGMSAEDAAAPLNEIANELTGGS